MFYSLQSTLKNALLGINPLHNRFMISCYLYHGFTYGLDTIDINPSDLDHLETKFRSVLRSLQSLSPSTVSAAVYLMAGVLPVVAERDIQIMRLVGQLAICDRELQNVSAIVEENLSRYGIKFSGWSGVARRTAALYGLPDPLELFQQPWSSKGFSQYAKREITKYWASYLQNSASSYDSLYLLDTSRLSLLEPHPIWTAAGSNSISIQRATVVSWLLLGVYQTRQRLYSINKVSSPHCVLCKNPDTVESQIHFTLVCPALNNIREIYLAKFSAANLHLNNIKENHQLFLISLLDPFSPKLPEELRHGWQDNSIPYEISRNYFSAIHKKRKTLMAEYDISSHVEETEELNTKLIISIYEKQKIT